MGNLISFMKEVADGLRESGNYGTAHIYRSSMSAILAFHGSEKLPFRKVSQEFLKKFRIVSAWTGIVAGIRFPPICVRCVQCITVRSTAILRLMCLITSGMSIQERARTGNVRWIRKTWSV